MKAIVWTQYGSPEGLHLQEVAQPTPKDDEVLIRIHASTVTAGDCELRRLQFSISLRFLVRLLMGLTRPRHKILGQELAGEVEAVGRNVRLFRKGDPIFGTTGFGFGAYAEYICLPERSKDGAMATKPVNMTYEEAAAVPTGGLEALHLLRRAGSLSGRKVLVNGAGGGIGLLAVQLARHFGAEVTGVDNAEKQSLVRSVGAQRVLDYAREDFTKSGEKYDIILDVVGRSAFSRCVMALTDNGRLLLANPNLSTMLRGLWISATGAKKVIFGASPPTVEELSFLRELIEAKQVRSVIDRQFSLEQVPEAHRYFETGRARGTVVISLDRPEPNPR